MELEKRIRALEDLLIGMHEDIQQMKDKNGKSTKQKDPDI